MSKVYSDQINKSRQLVNGLRNSLHLVKDKGLNEAFINQLEANNQLADSFNEENDKLRQELKNKTLRANLKLNEIKQQIKDAKKIIKQNYPQDRWIQFGINDKR